jgi:phytoene synthase
MEPSDLPPLYRLALAYAPRRTRQAAWGLLALDQRLGGIVRAAREPMLAQLKLAWWRDRLGSPRDDFPAGEPLLARLAEWGEEASELSGLVDGWEALLLDGGPAELVVGRSRACAALARVTGVDDSVEAAAQAGQRWAAAEFGLVAESATGVIVLPKELRALAVLTALSGNSEQSPFRQFLRATRIGLFGR